MASIEQTAEAVQMQLFEAALVELGASKREEYNSAEWQCEECTDGSSIHDYTEV